MAFEITHEYRDLLKRAAAGWNTWNTRSMTSHVRLPDGLAVNLGFCVYGRLAAITDVLVGREDVRPGPHAYDGNYTQLELRIGEARFSVETAHAEDGDLVALVTPEQDEVRPPALVVASAYLWNKPGSVKLRDSGGRADGGSSSHPSEASHGAAGRPYLSASSGRATTSIYADGVPVSDPNLPVDGPYLAVAADVPVGVSTGRERNVCEISRIVAAARRREQESHERYGASADVHRAMQACLAWNVIYEPLYDRIVVPVSRRWSVRRLGYVVFCWDTFFAAHMLASDDGDLAIACALEAFREMVDDTYVPNNTQGSGRRSWDRSQPPVGSLMVREVYRLHPRRWFLDAAFPPLLRWNRFWDRARKNGQGLLSWGSNPAAPRVGDPLETRQPNTLLGAVLESGLDNSPMYDGVPFDPVTHRMALSDVGLNALYVADCRALAEIAEAIGKEREAEELRGRAEMYDAGLQDLFSNASGIFLNRRTDTGAADERLSPTSFYPLLSGTATPEQAERMVKEHLANPKEFWGEWVIPSTPRSEEAYADNDYWRGRIWGPMNFLVYLGLRRYDLPEIRHALAERSAALLLKEWRKNGFVYENYNPDTGDGGDVRRADPYYHWGGLLGFIDLIENGLVTAPEGVLE